MTHRERAIKALNHEDTDFVPIDFGGSYDTTITQAAYKKLKKYLGQEEIGYDIAVFSEGSIFPDEELFKSLNCSFRPVSLPASTYDIHWNNDGSSEYIDEYEVLLRRPKGGYFFDLAKPSLVGELTIKKVEEFKWPRLNPQDLKNAINEVALKAKQIHEEKNYAIVGNFLMAPIAVTMLIRGFEDWSMDIMQNHKAIEALMDGFIDFSLEKGIEFYKKVGKYCDVVYCVGDDLATQDGLWFPPEIYKKYLKPRHKRIIDTVKKYTDAKILFHCCGAASDLFPDFIEIGVDIVTPVQVSSKGMDSKRLKKEYGKSLVFWGGIDTQYVMPFGTPEEVKKEVFKRLDDFFIDGGYILNTVHNILPDVPPENVIALIKAAEDWFKQRKKLV